MFLASHPYHHVIDEVTATKAPTCRYNVRPSENHESVELSQSRTIPSAQTSPEFALGLTTVNVVTTPPQSAR
jgi:hypothetical protein